MSQWHRDMVASGHLFSARLKGDTVDIVDQVGTVLFDTLSVIARELTQKEVIKFGSVGVVDWDKVFEIPRQFDVAALQFNCSMLMRSQQKIVWDKTYEIDWIELTDDAVFDSTTTVMEASVVTCYCKVMAVNVGEMPTR